MKRSLTFLVIAVGVLIAELLSLSSVFASGQVPTEWTTVEPSGMTSWNSIAYGDGKFVVAGITSPSTTPRVSYSSDGGTTWSTPAEIGTTTVDPYNTRVSRFHDRWVVSTNQAVWSSEDLTTWTEETIDWSGTCPVCKGNGTKGLFESFDGSTYTGVFVNNVGRVFVESSPGNWTYSGYLGSSMVVNASELVASNGKLLFAYGSSSVLQSADLGVTWSSVAPFSENASIKMLGISTIGSSVWVTGTDGFVAESSDDGSTWDVRNEPDATLSDMKALAANNEVLIAMGSTVGEISTRAIYSNDGGVTWQPIPDGFVPPKFSTAEWIGNAASETTLIGTSSSRKLMVGVLPQPPATTTPPEETTTTSTAPGETTTTSTAPGETTTISTAPAATTTTTAALPATVMTGADGNFAHAPQNGCQELDENGQVTPVAVQIDLDALKVTCGAPDSLEMDLAGNEPGATKSVQGQLTFFTGKQGVASGYGFQPGSLVEVWLASTPRMLGTTTVASDGTWTKVFDVPVDVAEGLHTIQAEGMSLSGQPQAVSAGVLISSTASEVELPVTGRPFTGWSTFAIIMVTVGACVLAVERKRTA